MIKSIFLENFKSFKNLHNLQIKPVTILCGTNSCGKSSILQSILTFRQTYESQNPNQTLLLNGRFTHLGSFENIIYDKNSDNIVSFGFDIKLKKQDLARLYKTSQRFGMPIQMIFRELIPRDKIKETTDICIKYKISLSSLDSSERLYLKPITVNSLSYHVKALSNDMNLSESTIEFKRNDKNQYKIIWDNINNRRFSPEDISSGESVAEVEFSNLSPISINVGSHPPDRNLTPPFIYIRRISDILRSTFISYSYIGPLREEPSRRYIYEDEVVEIGIKGENAAHIFLSEKDRKVNNHFFYNSENDSFDRIKSMKLSEGVQDWLDKMNIKSLKPEPTREIIYLKLDASEQNKTRVNIADVGFGVSQVFPIILEGLRMPIANTLILEQPEIHLHPKLQMHIADYCISLALSEKNVIAETHSDHVINRLVRRIVEDESGMLKNLIAIYFIKPSNDGSLFEEVIIDENRGIVNWPDEFFDQFSSEQQKIMKAGLSKRKKNRK